MTIVPLMVAVLAAGALLAKRKGESDVQFRQGTRVQPRPVEQKRPPQRIATSFVVPPDPAPSAFAPPPPPRVAADTGGLVDLELTAVPAGVNKIVVIKVIREITQLGLREAKDAVDEAPHLILCGIGVEQAEGARARLTAVGVTATIKPSV
ncbi:MAG: ribosomal protein bL12 [Candidatus Xenobia bacterium]